MVGEILDGIAKRDQHIQVREKAAKAAPQGRPSPDLPPQNRFADGGTQSYLCNSVQYDDFILIEKNL
jgi:hypothetical protein